MSNVKLAIRLRPFTERELKSEKDRIPVVNVVDEHTVTITNIKVSVSGAGDSRERVRRYTADYTFDSACPDTDPQYASQEKVFESIGREVVSCVARGASACVLAYGQSATGKTHTMMGTEHQPGLVPRLCRAFAEGALDVTVSFLEIYNERVHDLLAGEPLACHSLPRRRGNARKDLRVREHPERGPYVQNLRRVAVTDVETLLSLVEEGARRRRTAATRRNPISSRSHALLELATSKATLHLADLAGSENASWEGCGGGRQKEGANINKSLVALSNVISALVSGGHRGRFVPYRDSALTWLLKDCFTGGASTFIIATVSPSVACYGESASTLRWSERARHLRTPKVLTCGPSTASRAALQAQLNILLAELTRHHICYNLQTGKIAYEENHWTLQPTDKYVQLNETFSKDAKIGNIFTMFNPKTVAPNSQNSGSTASSVASGSSDVINTIDKNIREEINKEVDKLLTPALERTRSGSDFGAIAPLRHKRRQYKSQEALPIDKTLQVCQSTEQPTPSQSQDNLNDIQERDTFKTPHVPILYDNQRAEIVASVTERLYSKLKKKEEAAVSKMENVVDKKIIEPLSELRICTNARQRLMEMSQKAMRHKGRRIGIPAYTQTRLSVIRVRDQGIDVQKDLETYILKKNRAYILQKDVATETVPMTPRCKEIAVGPKSSSMNYRDRGTLTETKQTVHRNSFMMTDIVTKCDRCSQTSVVPPPRRKKRAKFLANNEVQPNRHCSEECFTPSVISINISQPYLDSESQSSDENMELQSSDDTLEERGPYNKSTNVSTTPDLLTNHNNIDTSVYEGSCESDHVDETKNIAYTGENDSNDEIGSQTTSNMPYLESSEKDIEEFNEEVPLPRVTVASATIVNQEEIKNLILGRNESLYPYNIILSPPREREITKRIVKFEDENLIPTTLKEATDVASQTSWEWACDKSNPKSNSSDTTQSDKERFVMEDCNNDSTANCSDSTGSSRVGSDTFIWTRISRSDSIKTKDIGYTPVYKSSSKRYKTARAKMYREFLGLRNDNQNHNVGHGLQYLSLTNANDTNTSDSTENEESINKFKQRRQFFEDKFKRNSDQNNRYDWLESSLLQSCSSLDASVNKYENYLSNFHDRNGRYNNKPEVSSRSPKEYLQHLVQLRREVVKKACETTDNSGGFSRK